MARDQRKKKEEIPFQDRRPLGQWSEGGIKGQVAGDGIPEIGFSQL